jgi:hypothetical protein
MDIVWCSPAIQHSVSIGWLWAAIDGIAMCLIGSDCLFDLLFIVGMALFGVALLALVLASTSHQRKKRPDKPNNQGQWCVSSALVAPWRSPGVEPPTHAQRGAFFERSNQSTASNPLCHLGRVRVDRILVASPRWHESFDQGLAACRMAVVGGVEGPDEGQAKRPDAVWFSKKKSERRPKKEASRQPNSRGLFCQWAVTGAKVGGPPLALKGAIGSRSSPGDARRRLEPC